MARLLLLRHAESEWNAQGRWQGVADPPLSTGGRRQAVAAGARLRELGLSFTDVVASDLERARLTARLIARALAWTAPITVEPGLREYDVGQWSGLTRAEIEARWPGAIEDWRHGRLVSTPGGEKRDRFVARVAATISRLGAAHEGGTLLVITHGGVIGALERALGGEPRRVPQLGGRWVEAGPDGLRSGEPETLDPGAPPEVVDGEASGYPAVAPLDSRHGDRYAAG